MLTDNMENFKEETINYNNYEVSFRRWLVSRIDAGELTMVQARDRFCLPSKYYGDMIRRWQDRYSDKMHLSLQAMSTEERTEVEKLEQRIKELEKQLKHAQMKNIAVNTLIDVAEKDYKLSIRKKSGTKQ